MKQEQVLAGLRTILAKKQRYTTWTVSTPHLVALVNKFVQDEREACAKVCETNVWSKDVAWWRVATKSEVGAESGVQCAKAIRARGTT